MEPADLGLRTAVAGEVAALEALQLRASLVWEEYREDLRAHPGAVAVPPEAVAARDVRVAEVDGTVAGFSVVLRSPSGVWELDGLFVEPELQRGGIGRRLVDDVVTRARSAGVPEVHVVANPRAVDFYRRVGFRAVAEAVTAFGPAVAMALDVGGIGDRYTHGHHDAVLRSHRWRTAENSAAYLLPQLRPGLDVLDVGCGPGTLTADLAARVAPGSVLAVDRASAVLDEARAACSALGNVEVRGGDVYALDLPDSSFDVVHAHQVLQHLSDPLAALVEMRRVCRPGGLLAVRDADYGAFTWAPADPALDRWLEVYRAVARANRAEPDAGRHLSGWVRAAGWSDVHAGASVWCFAGPEDRAWWGGLWAARLRESALGEQVLELGLADRAGVEVMAGAFERWAEQDDGWFAVLHGEVLARA